MCVTRVEKFGLAKGDGGEGEVAADEDHVGDAQGGQQVVEYVVHFPAFQRYLGYISECIYYYILLLLLLHYILSYILCTRQLAGG